MGRLLLPAVAGDLRVDGSVRATLQIAVDADGEIRVTGTAAEPLLVKPLRRQNAFDIDNTRESDFTTQGTGNVDD